MAPPAASSPDSRGAPSSLARSGNETGTGRREQFPVRCAPRARRAQPLANANQKINPHSPPENAPFLSPLRAARLARANPPVLRRTTMRPNTLVPSSDSSFILPHSSFDSISPKFPRIENTRKITPKSRPAYHPRAGAKRTHVPIRPTPDPLDAPAQNKPTASANDALRRPRFTAAACPVRSWSALYPTPRYRRCPRRLPGSRRSVWRGHR